VKGRQAALQRARGQFQGRLFPLAKASGSVFSAGCVISQGFQQAHCAATEKRNYPNIMIKQARKQTNSQENGRSQAPRLSYSEPQILCHIDISTERSTLISCCFLVPRDNISPDEASHYYVLPLRLSS